MRLRLPFALAAGLALLAAGFAPIPPAKDKKPEKKANSSIQGTWELTGLERGGGGNLKMPANYKMTLKITEKGFAQSIALKGQERDTPEADLKLDTKKTPPWFDVTTKGAKAARMQGVYKVDGDKLVLTYAPLKGTRPEKVEGDLGQGHMRMTLKRVRPATQEKK
jgi:uncharacterized protein (TIGR03067 family)